MGWNYIYISQPLKLGNWSVISSHTFWPCNYLSMLNRVSIRTPAMPNHFSVRKQRPSVRRRLDIDMTRKCCRSESIFYLLSRKCIVGMSFCVYIYNEAGGSFIRNFPLPLHMTFHISMAQCKTAVSPLLTHWGYCSLALSHRYDHNNLLRNYMSYGISLENHYTRILRKISYEVTVGNLIWMSLQLRRTYHTHTHPSLTICVFFY